MLNENSDVEPRVMAALTDTPEPSTAIWRRMDVWTLSTTRATLQKLARAGLVRRVAAPTRFKSTQYLYARAEARRG